MAESSFPEPVSSVISTLAEIFRQQGQAEALEVLEKAQARFEDINYDNWNGGTTTWALRLQVPASDYARIEARLAPLEELIAEKLAYLARLYPNDPICPITITPVSAESHAFGQRMTPAESETRRIWRGERFRLFLSHVARHKEAVSRLKNALEAWGVSAFVAHEDIEPSREWQSEIITALRSMDALAALITPDFHESKWTDQEIGWAFGRGILVIPIRLTADPYGFAGGIQGISGTLDDPKDLASKVVNVLVENRRTHSAMRQSLVKAFVGAASFATAKSLSALIVPITDFTEDEKCALRQACIENDQVARTFGVPEAIFRVFGRPPEPKYVEVADDLPF